MLGWGGLSKLSKICQVVKNMSNVKTSNIWTIEEVHKNKLTQWGSHILVSILMSHMKVNKFGQIYFYLGGLSLHLNHLIASRMGICYRQFGTLPIGILLSNLDSRQLDTSLMTSYGHFDICQLLVTPGPFDYFCQNTGPSEKSKFSRWRNNQWAMRLGDFRWADNWATWWYHFFGGLDTLKGWWGPSQKKKTFFRTFVTT